MGIFLHYIQAMKRKGAYTMMAIFAHRIADELKDYIAKHSIQSEDVVDMFLGRILAFCKMKRRNRHLDIKDIEKQEKK